MKAKVDKELCIGCGACEAICPKVFRLGDEGLAEVIAEQGPKEEIIDAAEGCPVSAIEYEE